jgi:hypothetical protein
MAEHVVVVVGSNQRLPQYAQGEFWVIDFSNAPTGAPTVASVPCSSGGVVVDCSGSLAAVAACAGGSVTIYDLTNPGNPRSMGWVSLPFSSISAVSFYGGSVLAGEANGTEVALIDINNMGQPQIYETGLDSVTDVALFGSNAIICGLGAGVANVFMVVNIANLSSLKTIGWTKVSDYNGDTNRPLMCDFDGVNAVFSDGVGLYVFNLSGATPTAVASLDAPVTSVAIAESGNSSGVPIGGVQVAYTDDNDANVELQYIAPPVAPGANWSSSSARLGDANNTFGQPNDLNGGVAKFCRSIWGTSALLATAGITQTSGGTQEYVVTLFDLSAGGGSIQAIQQGARVPVPLLETLTPNSTLAVTTFFTFPRWFPWPIPPWPWLRSVRLG